MTSPANVDGGDGSVTAAEDPVLHVLDVEVRAAEPVQDLREHADPVQVADRSSVDAPSRLGSRLTQCRASPAAKASTISATPVAMAFWA